MMTTIITNYSRLLYVGTTISRIQKHSSSSSSSTRSIIVQRRRWNSTISTTHNLQEQIISKLQSQFEKHATTTANDGIVFPLASQKTLEESKKAFTSKANLSNEKQAAVLVPLYFAITNDDNMTPSLLFTARSPHLPTHASEISFPGGHYQPDIDHSLTDTAIREAQEELQGTYPFDQEMIILGTASTIPTIRGTPVTPILAILTQPLQEPIDATFPGCDNEVEQVFGVSLQALLQTETSHVIPKNRYYGKDFKSPLFPTLHGQIWGLTALIIQPLLHKLYKPVFFTSSSNKE